VVHDIDYISDESVKSLYACASHDANTGDVILKVVNASADKVDTSVHLKGIGELGHKAEAIVLTSDKPTDENSLEQPRKVSPKTQALNLNSPDFQHVFPGNSFTVFRIGQPKGSL
jgi:alpha-L-arabinofuranosidase